jgi:transcriptional regulator with XRE-family HTH domain
MKAPELRQLRLGAGLTQKEMARRLGLSISALSRLENGKRKISHPMAIAVRCVIYHNR